MKDYNNTDKEKLLAQWSMYSAIIVIGVVLACISVLCMIMAPATDLLLLIFGIPILILSIFLIYIGYKNKKRIEAIIKSLKPVKVTCPYCKSNRVEKIITMNRFGSVMITGIASDKLGKQWHCNNCDSNF